MEFKLNKIDTDIRLKLQKEISEDKVSYSKEVNDTKDTVEERKNSGRNFSDYRRVANRYKRYFTIDGVKYSKKISVEAEKLEGLNEYNSKGITLDMRK